MGIGYTSKSILLGSVAQVVPASQTKQVISPVFAISAEDSLDFRADVTAASTSGTTSIMLQTSHDGVTWIDGKVVTVADGNVAITYLDTVAGDQTYLPLRPLGRLAVTTAAASGTTISNALRAARL
jgi:hypothetical protein